MAKPFVIRVGNLSFEFGAYTLIFFGFLASAGAVTARFFKPLLYHIHDSFVGVERNFHNLSVPKIRYNSQ